MLGPEKVGLEEGDYGGWWGRRAKEAEGAFYGDVGCETVELAGEVVWVHLEVIDWRFERKLDVYYCVIDT